MKKLSQLNETHWGGMVRRSSTDVRRKEELTTIVEEFLKKIIDRDKSRLSTIIDSYIINPDDTVDIVGNICIYKEDLAGKELPFKFGSILKLKGEPQNMFYELTNSDIRNIHGSFDVRNLQLKNLKNCPDYVEGEFDCGWNDIETLEGGPKYVGNFTGDNCTNLKSFKGCPEEIRGDFWMRNSTIHMESTEFFPQKIGGKINLEIRKHDGLGIINPEMVKQIFTIDDIVSKCGQTDRSKINIDIVY